MQASLTALSAVAFVLLGFTLFGGPMILVDWSRRRQREAIERQIALTDALDGRLGATVAPVVKKPLFGPWAIRIAVPFRDSATVARILPVVDEVFQDAGGTGSCPYRLFLGPMPDSLRGTCAPRAPKRWVGGPVAAA